MKPKPSDVLLRSACGKMKEGRERLTRRMVNSVAASKWTAADANKQRSVPSKDWKPEEIKENAVRAAREYLSTLDDAAFGAASL
jgi:hypothetical protein